MARASLEIVQVLRKTADKIECSTTYQWGHMGLCNCGFLAQEITQLKKEEIHSRAMQRYGDWREQLNDYCPTSGYPIDDLISEMIAFGFDRDDLAHLEKLSDPRVLQNLPDDARHLQHNQQHDVVKYLMAWANLVEQDLIDHIMLPSYLSKEETIL
jgi:hypothetical protein